MLHSHFSCQTVFTMLTRADVVCCDFIYLLITTSAEEGIAKELQALCFLSFSHDNETGILITLLLI